MNKKGILGGEFVLWFFRFFLLIILLVGIVAIVYILYSKQYDSRPIEAEILNRKIIECLSKEGTVMSADLINFNSNCNLNLDSKEIYIKIELEKNTEKETFTFGEDKDKLCEINDKIKMKYPPYCKKERYYVLYQSSGLERAYLNILIVILKVKENV